MRWKALIEMEKQQQEQVDRNIKEAREKLEMEMEAARHEHQVMLMRQGESHLHAVAGCLLETSGKWNGSSSERVWNCFRMDAFSRLNEAPGGIEENGGAAQSGGAEA